MRSYKNFVVPKIPKINEIDYLIYNIVQYTRELGNQIYALISLDNYTHLSV